MIPDYVLQVQEIHRNLESQSIVTRENWKDSVAQRFYDNFIKNYDDKIYLYIHGGMGMTGKGLNDLLQFFDQKQNEMTQLTGMSLNIDAGASSKVHNEYRERDPWSENYDGPQPGNLDAGEVKGIMNERNYHH
jgi:hypothetical protein